MNESKKKQQLLIWGVLLVIMILFSLLFFLNSQEESTESPVLSPGNIESPKPIEPFPISPKVIETPSAERIDDPRADPIVRAQAVHALAQRMPEREDAVSAMLGILARLPPGEVHMAPRCAALTALGERIASERARGRLVEALRASYPSAERIAAIQTMTSMGSQWSHSYLERALATESDESVRKALELALAKTEPD